MYVTSDCNSTLVPYQAMPLKLAIKMMDREQCTPLWPTQTMVRYLAKQVTTWQPTTRMEERNTCLTASSGWSSEDILHVEISVPTPFNDKRTFRPTYSLFSLIALFNNYKVLSKV